MSPAKDLAAGPRAFAEDLAARTRAFAKRHFFMADDDFKVWDYALDPAGDTEIEGYYRDATQVEINKAVLLAVCPRLERVWAHRYPDAYNWPLNFAAQAIKKVHSHAPKPVWPEGFAALEVLYIGAAVRHRDDRNPLLHFTYNACDMAPFFVLPNIDRLIIRGPDPTTVRPPNAFMPPPHSSQLEDWEILEGCLRTKVDLMPLLQSAKALRKIDFSRCCVDDLSGFIQYCGRTQAYSLSRFAYRPHGSFHLEPGLFQDFKVLSLVELNGMIFHVPKLRRIALWNLLHFGGLVPQIT